MIRGKASIKESKHKQQLVDLGLTNLEAKIYYLLNRHSPSTVKELSSKLNVMTSSIHRTLVDLKDKGLVSTSDTRPLIVRVVAPSIALPRLIDQRHNHYVKLEKDLETALGKHTLSDELKIEFLENKQAAYYHSIDIANNTKKEIIIFSVGEPIPEELFLAMVRAIQRGVEIKMIAQKYTGENKELLENLKKNGYKIRHLSAPELDFTLVVYDKRVTDLHIRAPSDPDERIGVSFYNPSYSQAQYRYLLELWDKAKEI